jgi:hypothetical protein
VDSLERPPDAVFAVDTVPVLSQDFLLNLHGLLPVAVSPAAKIIINPPLVSLFGPFLRIKG